MVGFGSSLRKARRPGWEGSYLDYETLKLLLSQIEAVYEEEGHRRRGGAATGTNNHHLFLENAGEGSGEQLVRFATRDYRDELFLEQDSEAAFESTEETDAEQMILDPGSEIQDMQSRHFSLNYSQEILSSSEEDSNIDPGCGSRVGGRWPTWRSSPETSAAAVSNLHGPATKHKKGRLSRSSFTALPDNGDYFSSTTRSSFFVTSFENRDGTSNYNVQNSTGLSSTKASARPYSNEGTSLLPPATPLPEGSSLYSIDSVTSPPSSLMRLKSGDYDYKGHHHMRVSTTSVAAPQNATNSLSNNSTLNKKQLEERNHERKLRRMKKQRKQRERQARERKVPRHLRVAHAKARAITERFLGLLRAETEKVLLFAQSRLGELADTTGSLRFPCYDDDYSSTNYNYNDIATRSAGKYGYPLSDGGLHPSASSSDDEGLCGGHGLFPWSDSSEDETASRGSQKPVAVHSATSIGAISEETLGRSNRSSRRVEVQQYLGATSRKHESSNTVLHTARRQIAHFTDIRKRRPLFQRNDHILGEDLLFLSAVEEADGYTAVGVELLHVIRFICVNLVAVRKICRKHDRLLMNRMLGGYYHRARLGLNGRGDQAHIKDAKTLGGLMAQASGDIYEAHPALIGQINHYRLVGVYDRKIQKLANSRTVQVVSSCLSLALSEYEVARSRADALTRMKSTASVKSLKSFGCMQGLVNRVVNKMDSNEVMLPILDNDDEGSGGPPSTASSMSLTRLRFTVTSIFALREAARCKLDPLSSYISRSALTYTGPMGIGEGLDGCSRETLDFLVCYDPDSALLLHSSLLFEGLQKGNWINRPLSDVMTSVLATAMISEAVSFDLKGNELQSQEVVENAVCVAPESKDIMLRHLLRGQAPKKLYETRSLAITELPRIALWLAQVSAFLFSVNFFVAHASTNTFVRASGGVAADSALIIGAPNLSAILSTLIQCYVVSNDDIQRNPIKSVHLIRRMFLISSIFGFAGNMTHALAVNRNNVRLAIAGRFVMGFSSTTILERHVISFCLPSYVVPVTARLVQYRIIGVLIGLLIGSVMELLPITICNVGVRAVQSASWILMVFWLFFFVLVLQWLWPETINGIDTSGDSVDESRLSDQDMAFRKLTDSIRESDSSGETDEIETPPSMYYQSAHDGIPSNPLAAKLIASTEVLLEADPYTAKNVMKRKVPIPELKKRAGTCKQLKTFINRIHKLLSFQISIPICFLIILFTSFSFETIFTATPIVTQRYFGWTGFRAAGLILGSFAACSYLIVVLSERVVRRYEERTVIKKSLHIVSLGLFVMINWVKLFSLAKRVNQLLIDLPGRETQHYDWKIGSFQYVIGSTIVFVGLTATESANLSLLSKISPARFRSIFLNVGTLATLLSFTARLAADLQIFMIDLSHKVISTDIVNVLVIPLLLSSFLIAYFVKRHYFFLM